MQEAVLCETSCRCPECQSGYHSRQLWHEQVRIVMSRLSEQQRRWVAGLLSKSMGHGGDTLFACVTGLDEKTIKRGRDELDQNLEGCPTDRIRRPGAGRPPLEKKTLRCGSN